HEFGQRFRIVVAMGFFDYMSDPGPVIKKIASLTAGVFLASFPRQSIVWGLQRSIRYRLIKRCPVYNYTRDQLNSLFPSGLFADVRILETSHGFFAVAWNRQSD
ncbi:MAG TPA: hypothetical protein VK463_06355, partial [Desulfomonilaceae bacterium]|nr:hypothetical protein [Desulfomonilaceae bacterium]